MTKKFDLERAISRTLKRYHIQRPSPGEWAFVMAKTFVPGLHRNSTYLNLDRLEILLHEYIYVSYIYGQYISIIDFCRLAGIARQTFYDWIHGKSRKDNEQAKRIIESLREERNISIQYALESPSRCLGALAVLRHECNWTQESITDFADTNGLICADPQSVKDRYRAVADSENA